MTINLFDVIKHAVSPSCRFAYRSRRCVVQDGEAGVRQHPALATVP